MSGEDGFCAKCCASQDVLWCPAWQEWLCITHRHERTYRELDATERPDGWALAQVRPVPVTVQ